MMKDGAYLVNFAKGAVNEVSLVEYLEKKNSRRCFGCFRIRAKARHTGSMILRLSLSPNVASVTTDAQGKTGKELVEQIIKISREYYAHI